MYHMCCAHIASLEQRACIAIQPDAYLTRVVGLLLITRFNDRKWGRMTRRLKWKRGWERTDRGCTGSGYTTTVLIDAGATPYHTILASNLPQTVSPISE
jgi:hypothetical protein